jgi:hypothetical protein
MPSKVMVIRDNCEADRIVQHAFASDSLSRQDIIPVVDKPFEAWITFKQFPAFISELAAKAMHLHSKTNLSPLHREVTLFRETYGGHNAEWFVIGDYSERHWPIGFQLLRQLDVLRQVCNTGRFIMFSVITNICNKKTKGLTLMELNRMESIAP